MKEKGLHGSRTKKVSLRLTYYLTTNQNKRSSYYKKSRYIIFLFHCQLIVEK